MSEMRSATCMLCEAMCGLEVTVEEGRATRIAGDRRDPFSKGHLCPKAAAIDDVRLDPDRVVHPMKRTRGGAWDVVSWDSALSFAAERLDAIRRAHGRHAVATYAGNPVAHSYGALLGSIALRQTLSTRNNFSATSADQLPHMLAALEMFGHQLLLPVPDIDRSRFFLVVGANPAVSNGSLMTAPGVADRLRAVRARGGRVVVIDPRRTETAELAGEHHFIRPGTDALLLFAMLHVVFAEGRERPGRLLAHIDGIEALRDAARPFSPARVASLVGIDAECIERLARDFATADGAVCYTRLGASTQEFGSLAIWAGLALEIVTGNLDRPGGRMFTTPAADVLALTRRVGMRGSFGRFRTGVRGLPEFGGELPVATLAEEIEGAGESRIRALVTLAGNPVLSAPNGPALERALASLDFMVSIDVFRNETTRHADLLLPPTFGFERDHYDLVFSALAVRNTARYAPALFPPRGEARDDFDITTALALALARRAPPSPRAVARLASLRALRAAGARRLLDGLLRVGPHRLSIGSLEQNPHGVDLGPLEPRLPEVLGGRKRIAIAPSVFVGDLPRLLARLEARAPELALVGRRSLRSNNSWLHNSHRLVKGRNACTLHMHPVDAAARGLASGDEATLSSRVGEVVAEVFVTDTIAPGVVSLPHGWGHHREGATLRVASANAGASVNDVTDERFVDALTGNAAFSGVPVEVTRCS